MIEIGHVSINYEVSLLALLLTMPRQRYLEEALHIMGYLKLKHNAQLEFDPTCLKIDQCNFGNVIGQRYEGAVEAIPTYALLP